MKGIITAGGLGSRLHPCTLVTNKHLLPVYDRPMIYYPLMSLVEAGIKDILIVSGPEHSGHFVDILGDGEQFGCHLQYIVQNEPGGIAQAVLLGEDFADNENIAVILGDNIFSNHFGNPIKKFKHGAHIFLKQVDDAERFGVAEIDDDFNVLGIEEKPKKPKSNLAVTGCYLYDHTVFDKIKKLKPSSRGELEITDVGNLYLKEKNVKATVLDGVWTDAGTFPSLHRASMLVRENLVRKPF